MLDGNTGVARLRSLTLLPLFSVASSVLFCCAVRADTEIVDGPDWLATVTGTIAAMEYDVSSTERGVQAPNRVYGIRTFFRNGGIEVVPRDDAAPAWSWSWRTTGVGRVGAPAPVEHADPSYAGSRAEYHYAGFTEWYENSEAGLQQGFLLPTSLPGTGPVCLTGIVQPSGSSDIPGNRGALFHTDVEVRDATGRVLDGEVIRTGATVRIVIDDQHALYPLRIARELLDSTWQRDGEQDHAQLGIGLSTAGDVNGDGYSDVAIGAPYYDAGHSDQGRVYVFFGSSEGLSHDDYWTADGLRIDALFGTAVSTAGDVNGDGYHDLIVGSPGHFNPDGSLGRVFAYHGRPTGMGSSIMWEARSSQTGDTDWGASVSTAGDVNGDGYDDVIFGACLYDDDFLNEGRVYLHLGSSSGLELAPVWFTDGNGGGANYGRSIAAAGDVNADGYGDIIVGAPHFDGVGGSSGHAFLYLGGASGPSTTPDWTMDGEDWFHEFGTCVAGAGDTDGDGHSDVLVGAPFVTDDRAEEGRAYLFRGTDSAAGLENEPAWTIDGDGWHAHLGAALATAGDVNGDGFSDVLIGAPGFEDDQDDEGRVFLYHGSWAGLEADPRWSHDGDQEDCGYGSRLATAGDVNGDGFSDLLIAAPHFDDAQTNEGRVWLHLGSGDGPKRTAGWVIESNQVGARFAAAVANAGDVNGDGFEEVLVGVPYYDNGQADEGAVFLFLGHPGGPSNLPDWWAESDQAGADFGASIAGDFDVNGDGYDDVLVGAPRYDGINTDSGRAFLWLGSPDGGPYGNPGNAAWWAGNGHEAMDYGRSVASAGDVNGDGYGDAIIGAPNYYSGDPLTGEAFVYHGSAGTLELTPSWSGTGRQTDGHYGYSVAGAGDVNADGFSDILVGEPDWSHSEEYLLNGYVYLYEGSPGGLASEPHWFSMLLEDGAHFGYSVSSSGDLNGDGYSDFAIGGPGVDRVVQDTGEILSYVGGPDDPERVAIFTTFHAYARLGHAVSFAGDIDGDGYADLLMGSPGHPNVETGTENAGMVAYLPGCEDWPLCAGGEAFGYSVNGNQEGAFFGGSVASLDVNGDGFSDVLSGAMLHTQGQNDEGRAFIFYGNDSRGLSRAPEQRRADSSAPVALLGVSDESDRFGLRAHGRSAAGRQNVWMEWEVEPFGIPFDGLGIESGSLLDTGVPDESLGSVVLLDELVTGLEGEATYHWRLRIAASDPYFPRTPWFSLPGNGLTEMDLRTAGGALGTDEHEAPTTAVRLDGFPNPFSTASTVRFTLRTASDVEIAVYDLQGRRVRSLLEEHRSAGLHRVFWDGHDDHGRRLASGIYWVKILADAEERSYKLSLLR